MVESESRSKWENHQRVRRWIHILLHQNSNLKQNPFFIYHLEKSGLIKMSEQVRIDDGVAEWEAGLPTVYDLASLSQALVPDELASAFRILPEPLRSLGEVNRASQSTLSSLRHAAASAVGPNFKVVTDHVGDCEMSEPEPQEGSDPKKSRLMDPIDEEAVENFMDDQSMEVGAKALKRPRLVWTPELHRRFVEVVSHLGLKNAVPKAIMQLMNVDGLTRENVASHLQKYRLYVKRMQGLFNEGTSPSDHLFASTPVPLHSFNDSSNWGGTNHANGNGNGGGNGSSKNSSDRMPFQMPYPPTPHAMPIPVMGMAEQNMNSGYEAAHSQHHYQQQYNNMMQQQINWSGNMHNSHLQHCNQNNK